MTALAVALAVAAAVVMAAPARLRSAGPRAPSAARRRVTVDVRAAAVLVALGAALLVGGVPGAALGITAGVATWVVVPRLRTKAQDARRRDLVRHAPLLVDLMAACLASGASVERAVAATGQAVPGAAGDVLVTAAAALRLGADPEDVWRTVGELPELAPLARAAARSARTGAPLAGLLPRVADDLRAAHRTEVEARVRTAAVRLTAPLGAAFLPSFVLLGVVPVVASWVGAVL